VNFHIKDGKSELTQEGAPRWHHLHVYVTNIADLPLRTVTPGFQRYAAVLRIRFRNRFRKNRVRTAVP